MFLKNNSNGNRVWLGGKDNRSLWEDGTRFDYENWSPDHQTRPGDCIEMTSGIWKNRNCNISHENVYFSCKKTSPEEKDEEDEKDGKDEKDKRDKKKYKVDKVKVSARKTVDKLKNELPWYYHVLEFLNIR